MICVARSAFLLSALLLGSTALAEPAAVEFPLDRTQYIAGEKVPLALTGKGDVAISLHPQAGEGSPLEIYRGRPQALVLDTALLAPAVYEVHLNGQASGATLTIASGERSSPAAIVNEQVWGVRELDAVEKAGVNAIFVMGNAKAFRKRDTTLDELVKLRTLVFSNPSTRPTSFKPPRAWQWEMDNYAMRLGLISQSHLRYPTWGGFCFEWDPSSVIRHPSIFFRMGEKNEEWNQYQRDSNEAIRRRFRDRTGLEPPSAKDVARFAAGIGRPESGPVIDLPTVRWMERIAQHIEKPSPAELADLEKRIKAWHSHLMYEYARGHEFFQRRLDQIDPTMAHTSSVNLDHGPASRGNFAPAAYQHLDFRHMSAWNDQIGKGDYDFQWLLSGALMNARNPHNQPIWVAQAGGHEGPGKYIRAASHNLIHNGLGIGSAAEGGYSWVGAYRDGKQHVERIARAVDFMNRFSSLVVEGQAKHDVAILYSETNIAGQTYQENFGTSAWQALVTLTRLGYNPRFITEEEILDGRLADYKVLTVWKQEFELPEEVNAKIKAFAEGGGRVVVDAAATVTVPGMEKMDAGVKYVEHRRVFGWVSPSWNAMPGGMPAISEHLTRRLAPAVLKTLGETGRAIYHQKDAANSDVTLGQIDAGPDASFVIATNDSWYTGHWSHMVWHQVKEPLLPSSRIAEGAVRYDLNEERLVGQANQAFDVDLTGITARVFGVVSRPIEKINLSATQKVAAGKRLALRVTFDDQAGRPLAAALPLHLTIRRPDGSVAFEGYRGSRRDGQFDFVYQVPANSATGRWTVAVRSQLTGQVATLLVDVTSADAKHVQPVSGEVVSRQSEAIGRVLSKGATVTIPVFDSPQAAGHLRIAGEIKKALSAQGIQVKVWKDPTMATYHLNYTFTDAQRKENALVDEGQAIGTIQRDTHRGEDYYTSGGKYRYGGHLILLDLAGTSGDNVMAEQLDSLGALWPSVTPGFPGKGKAVVQLVHGAFDPTADTIVIQAADGAGLSAAARGLTKLPTDWIGQSVSQARLKLLQQWNIHGGVPAADSSTVGKLTSGGLQVEDAPQPFRLQLSEPAPKRADEPKLPDEFTFEYQEIPVELDVAQQTYAQQRVGDGYGNAAAGKRTGNADLRFSDATLLAVDVKEAGKYKIHAEGVFRYSDRLPRSQGSWKAILAIYEEVVPRERRPMEWIVQVDGEEVGKLTPSKTAQVEVPIETLPFYSRDKPKSVTEEGVTELTGTVKLPAGKHRVRLIYRHMIDGRLDGVRLERAKP